MKAKHCDECKHFNDEDVPGAKVCEMNHKPRWYWHKNDNPHDMDYGYKRKCGDYEKPAKVGVGGTAIVTRKMLTAAHGVTLESGDVVLSARLLERIYLAMEQAAPPPKTPFDTCPTCEALARTVMMDQTGTA